MLQPDRASRSVIPGYFADAEGQRRYTRRLFDSSATDYDRFDRLLAFGTGSWYRRQALLRAGLAPGMQVLDVAVGTGLVAREAAAVLGASGQIVGIDPSPGMLAQAQALDCALALGRAESLPIASGSVDFLCMGYALRHIGDVPAAFAEFRRVLRPGGRLLMLEITRPEGRIACALLKAYLHGVVPALARLFARSRDTSTLYRFYWETIEACVPPARIIELLGAAGFAAPARGLVLGIFSEYSARAD
jgi:demethylmenaquinone methyltransferase/2-methoxy-6-polyprenyl-1,4-benzoquinol methylase